MRAHLRAFTAKRAELLAVLKPLSPEGWSRTATAMTAGGPRLRDFLMERNVPLNNFATLEELEQHIASLK